ncbi:hypothetical protein [Chitinophaga caseinilytica]|uniref:Orn/DAP/Arg decarboxylase 2 N-terminal domain-containing protein n=1 Tax=Chitinophaga caseinilytica TaxID=2267521 RepID=A0ABZ2Z3L5_9BACT
MAKQSDVLSADFLVKTAQEFGTPVYIYHAEKIKTQYEKLKTAFSKADARFFYACKALTNINVLRYINSIGCGLDTVSIQEVQLGLKAGFDPKNIIFTPNCVDLSEIIAAKELGVNLNIDNISILEQFGNQFGDSYPICIRLNPHIMAGGNFKISTGHVDSKFGISIHQMRHIERISEKHETEGDGPPHAHGLRDQGRRRVPARCGDHVRNDRAFPRPGVH